MIDLSYMKKFTNSDPKKMKRYILLYLETAPEIFEEMKKNMEKKNWDQLRINAHSLKPQAEFMGIPNLKEVLIEIEDAVKLKKLNEIKSLVNKAYNIHLSSEKELKLILER